VPTYWDYFFHCNGTVSAVFETAFLAKVAAGLVFSGTLHSALEKCVGVWVAESRANVLAGKNLGTELIATTYMVRNFSRKFCTVLSIVKIIRFRN
jgi:hypothetical protein